MSFATGLQTALDQGQREFERRRQLAADARSQEIHGLQVAEMQRAQGRQRQLDSADDELAQAMANGGRTNGFLNSRYGLTPDQVKAAGSGLPERLASYDTPDSYDLQNTSAATLSANAGFDQRRALNNALARRDVLAGQTDKAAGRMEANRGIDVEQKFTANRERLSDPAYREELARRINLTNGRMIMYREKDAKGRETGPWAVRFVDDNGKVSKHVPSEDELMQLAMADAEMSGGFSNAAMTRQGAVNTSANNRVKEYNNALEQGARINETGRHNYATEGIQRDHYSMMYGLQKAKDDRDKYQLLNPQMAYRMGADGKPVPVMTGLRLATRGGGYEAVEMPMPQGRGLIPANVLDPRTYAKEAEAMVGSPTGGIGLDGKPAKHTVETAINALMNQAIGRYADSPAASGGINLRAVEESKRAAESNSAPAAPAQPPRRLTDDEILQRRLQEIAAEQEAEARRARIRQEAGGARQLGLPAPTPAWANPQYNGAR